MNTGLNRKILENLEFCRPLTDLHINLDSASDYNAVYNYITKNQACQEVFYKKFKFFPNFIHIIVIEYIFFQKSSVCSHFGNK